MREGTPALQLGQQQRTTYNDPRQPMLDKAADPITLGFERLNARFDSLDRRVETLERPRIIPNKDDDTELDEADQEWEEYRRPERRTRDLDFRPYFPRGRGRGKTNRGGRRGRGGEFFYPARGGRDQQRSDDQEVRQNRRRDNWDPPPGRHDDWGDDDQYDERALTVTDPPWTRRRQPTCWDPPWTRRTTAYQHSSSYELDMYSPSPPKRRPTCWDPPVYRETPRQRPFNEVSVYDQPLATVPNSRRNQPYTARDTAAPLHTFPRRYSVRGPASQQPRSAIIAEDPINAELDHLLEVWDRKETHVDATDHRVSKFRSLSQPDQPDVSSSRRTLEYPPSRNTMASRGQSGLYPNVSLAPPRHSTTESTNLRPDFQPPQGNPSIQRRPLVFQQSDQPATRQPSCLESPLTATIAAKQPDQNYQPPPPLPQSDRQPQRPSPSPPLELLPYAAPEPFQPLHSLPVTAPFAVSNLHPQAAIPSSMKKKWVTNIQEGEEMMEIENIIVEYKAAIETTKSDLIVEMDELRLKSKELGKKGDGSYTSLPVMACVYMDLNVGDVTSMIHRPTSLDTDARLIPPRNNKPCLRIQGCVAELSILALNLDDHISPPLLIFYGGDEERRSAVRCVFDPGGDVSPKSAFNSLCCFVVPTLRTRWISTMGELIRSSSTYY